MTSTPRGVLPALALASLLGLAGCLSPEQRMAIKVENFMDRQQYEPALRYLDGYLAKHSKSLNGWRYRVLIRLEQGERAAAAAEYVALEDALARHEPEVLREVVLGGGGRWLLSDYRALARCANAGVADAAFFADLLEPKLLSEGSMSKVAVPDDEVAAVLDALPGRLLPSETWPLVERYWERGSDELRVRVTRAAGRHLASEGLTTKQEPEAKAILLEAAASPQGALREAALLGAQALPEARAGLGAEVVGALVQQGDVKRALSGFLLGPRGQGPEGWSAETLSSWAETAQEPVRVLAVATLIGREEGQASAGRVALLDRAAASDDPATRLAAVAAAPLAPGWRSAPDAEATWSALSVEQKRAWGPVFVRSAAPDAGAWATRVLGDTDALVVEQGALALALPGAGADPAVDAALTVAMEGDPSARAAAAAAAVVRGADTLGNPVGALLAKGDDRSTEAVLTALRDTGRAGWDAAVTLGMQSPVPTTRELAVDAAVATCDPGRTEQMFTLLSDADPHVAVRAASALYLLIGG